MSVQNILKSTALSAMLFSVVAAPNVINADSNPKTDTKAVQLTDDTGVYVDGGKKMVGYDVVSKITDPVQLAKKYAPETVEDWQKTLEQYRKSLTSEMVKDIVVEKSDPNGLSSSMSVSVKAVKAIPAEALSMSKEVVKDAEQVKAEVATIAVALSSTEAKQANTALSKAWSALSAAEESEDATAIKKALAELLKEYKQAIVDMEAAAK